MQKINSKFILLFLILLNIQNVFTMHREIENQTEQVEQNAPEWQQVECSICLERLFQPNMQVDLFGCGHPFHGIHRACNNNLLTNCPICRASNSSSAAAILNVTRSTNITNQNQEHRQSETFNRSLDASRNINARDNYVYTVQLIEAARNGRLDIVNRLLENPNIDVNAKDYYGYTALIWAADKGRLDIVNRLLQVPYIDVNAKSNHGKTALYYARQMRSKATFFNVNKASYNVIIKLLKVDPRIVDDKVSKYSSCSIQ